MLPFLETSGPNHSAGTGAVIDLMSPNNDPTSSSRPFATFTYWHSQASQVSNNIFDCPYYQQSSGPTASFSTVLERFEHHRPSGYANVNMGLPPRAHHGPSPSHRRAAPMPEESFQLPQQRVSSINNSFLSSARSHSQTNSIKQQCPASNSSSFLRGGTKSQNFENSRVTSKKRKLEESSSGVTDQCCICLEEPEDKAIINGCEHKFCFDCIEKWSERENTCPLCKIRFTQIERSSERKKTPKENIKKVKHRDQRTDNDPSNAIQGWLANVEGGSMGAALTQLLLSGLQNPQGSFVTFTPTHIRPIQASHTVPAPVPYTTPARQYSPVVTRSQRAARPAVSRNTSEEPIFLDVVDESIFDSETNPNQMTSLPMEETTAPTNPQNETVEDFDTDSQDNGYENFVRRVRHLSRERNAVLQRFQYNSSPQTAYNVDAGDSPENALEIFDDDSDQDDVVEVIGASDST